MILAEAVALGLVFSLYSSEVLGFIAGGLVVPGYFVVISSKPLTFISTVGVAFIAYFLLRLLSTQMLLYGRRRLLIAVLLGFIFSHISRQLVLIYPSKILFDLQAFGFVIPGLLAYWMDKQGVIPTLSMLMVNVAIVRLILILVHGGEVVV